MQLRYHNYCEIIYITILISQQDINSSPVVSRTGKEEGRI